jgi:hypothetical protein
VTGETDKLLAQAVRQAAAFVNALDGGFPPPLANDDRITERRRGELVVERVVPGKMRGGHPMIHVRRNDQLLLRAALAPGWETSDQKIEILDRDADMDWATLFTARRAA